MLAFDTAREVRLSQKETKAADMDQKFYDLEVERTRNLGNMSSALLMLASSMDTLTRFVSSPTPLQFKIQLMALSCVGGFPCGGHFAT